MGPAACAVFMFKTGARKNKSGFQQEFQKCKFVRTGFVYFRFL